MSFGKMNTFIQIVETISIKDDEGFTSKVETVLASVRAYKEEKRGTRKWANLSSFTEADCMFTFRVIPNLEIRTGQSIISNDKRYKIVSVQNIRGMYIEVLSVNIEATKE